MGSIREVKGPHFECLPSVSCLQQSRDVKGLPLVYSNVGISRISPCLPPVGMSPARRDLKDPHFVWVSLSPVWNVHS